MLKNSVLESCSDKFLSSYRLVHWLVSGASSHNFHAQWDGLGRLFSKDGGTRGTLDAGDVFSQKMHNRPTARGRQHVLYNLPGSRFDFQCTEVDIIGK